MSESFESNKILITGATGNIGFWLSLHFLENGFSVLGLSRNADPILLQYKNYYNLSLDISNEKDLRESLSNHSFSYCIHAASDNSKFSKTSFEVNVVGTKNLVTYLNSLTYKVRLIYLSTFQVYKNYEGYINEESKIFCYNDYSTNHICAENICLNDFENKKRSTTVLRLTNTYGFHKHITNRIKFPRDLISDLCFSAKNKNVIHLLSKKEEQRDFISLNDICKIIFDVLKNWEVQGTYNLSSNITYTNLEVARMVKKHFSKIFSKNVKIIKSFPEEIKVRKLSVDSTKLELKVNTNHIDQVETTIINYLNHLSKT